MAFEIAARSTGAALPDWASLDSEDDGVCGEDMATTVDEDGTRENYWWPRGLGRLNANSDRFGGLDRATPELTVLEFNLAKRR